MKILIDGDSCCVKGTVESIAKKSHLKCHIYADTSRNITSNYSEIHIVDKQRDSADFAIVNNCKAGDIVITADGGLAAMVLAKKAFAVNPYGFQYTNHNIGTILQNRYMKERLAKKGGRSKSYRGLKTHTSPHRESFPAILWRIINDSRQKKSNKNTGDAKDPVRQKG